MRTLLIDELLQAFRSERLRPLDLVDEVLAAIASAPERHAWITRLPRDAVRRFAERLRERDPQSLPLYGVPFAIKDNIDLAGVPTTAACPAFAYTPEHSASVVQKLIDAGAIPVGKTNLDQFATGLVGTRSPYGAGRNSFNEEYIAGGSSSGSAVAVATGLVSFALGTDTAGSGRVPAAFNNIVGLKPSCGRLSTRGLVPACRSLDCISVFALTAADAARVLEVAEGFDPLDAYSRRFAPSRPLAAAGTLRVGVPRPSQLAFFGDQDYAALFAAAIERARALGWQVIEVDVEPFLATARLLYEGPWVAERYAAVGEFLEQQPAALHPVTRDIIAQGARASAVATFRAHYRLKELARASEAVWSAAEVLLMPTAGSIYRIAEVLAEPVALNSNLGYYTNFVNLLDLAGVAVPAGFRRDGLPFGVTLLAQAGSDRELLELAGAFHAASVTRLGALDRAMPPPPSPAKTLLPGFMPLMVCGAHMDGLPLNGQLIARGAHLLQRTRTAPKYRFYALPGGPPHRPGLVRVSEGGAAIDVEVWAVPLEQLGAFIDAIAAPLGVGKVELADGTQVSGFLCESCAVADARDITAFGGWRQFLSA